jgi:hypothetical protein
LGARRWHPADCIWSDKWQSILWCTQTGRFRHLFCSVDWLIFS